MKKNESLIIKLSPELIKSIQPELFAGGELRLKLHITPKSIRVLNLSERLLKALLNRKEVSIDELLTEFGISLEELKTVVEFLRKLKILL